MILGVVDFSAVESIFVSGVGKILPNLLVLSTKVHFDFVSREDKNESTPTKIKK